MRRTLTKEEIDNIFKDAIDQSDAVVKLYRLAFPEWDNIKSIDGWPMIGTEAHKYIFKKAIEFDQKHHPKVVAGGLWLNKGFSSLEGERAGLPPWDLDSDNCKLEMEDPAQ